MNKKQLKEGLADMAYKAESDHEVQMARAELYKIAKYSIKLHEMLKGVDESAGLEGWVQSKITKSADYLGSVYHHLDYQMKFDEVAEAVNESEKDTQKEAKEEATCGCGPDCGHCGGKHTMKEVGTKCSCCDNEVKAVTAEGKYKNDAQRKAVHASKADKKKTESYKNTLANMLNEKVANSKCKDCGKPSYTTLDLDEEKQKGVDGKVCWKGYKRMGTKKKGGKTVDNCVKA